MFESEAWRKSLVFLYGGLWRILALLRLLRRPLSDAFPLSDGLHGSGLGHLRNAGNEEMEQIIVAYGALGGVRYREATIL